MAGGTARKETFDPSRNFQTIAVCATDALACVAGLEGAFEAHVLRAEDSLALVSTLGEAGRTNDAWAFERSVGVVPADPGCDGAGHVRVAALRHWASEAHGDTNRLLVVDNREAGPYLCRPLTMGADCVVESARELGLADDDPAASERVVVAVAHRSALDRLEKATGVRVSRPPTPAQASSTSASLVLRTLSFTTQHRSDVAMAAAHYLACHPAVSHVSYPGLADDASNESARSTFEHGFGPIVAFELDEEVGSHDAAPLPLVAAGRFESEAHWFVSNVRFDEKARCWVMRAGLESPLDVVGGLERFIADRCAPQDRG